MSQAIQISTRVPFNLSSDSFQDLPASRYFSKHFLELTKFQATHNFYESIPAGYFSGYQLKNIDLSNNRLRCVKDAFDGLKIKKLTFKDNEFLVAAAGTTKAKKKKVSPILNIFDKLPQGGCVFQDV